MKRLGSIQYLRGIAAVLVVVLHISAFEREAGVGEAMLPGWIIFASSGVDLFFVISGFVMVYTTRSAAKTAGEALRFLWRRATRIYPLYWLYTAGLLAGYWLLPGEIRRSDLEQVELLHSLLLLPQSQLPYLVVGWTLVHEMYFYAVFAVLLLLPARFLPAALAVWLSAVAFIDLGLDPATPAMRLLGHPLTLEFILGCFAALAAARRPCAGSRPAVLAVLLLTAAWCSHYWLNQGSDPSGWLRALLFGCPYATVIYVLCSLELRGRAFENRHLLLLGGASYSLYLCHFPVLSLLSKVWAKCAAGLFEADGIFIDNAAFAFAALVISSLVGILSYRLIEQPLIRAARRFGRRQADTADGLSIQSESFCPSR